MNKRFDPYEKLTPENSLRPQVDISHEMSGELETLIAERTKLKASAGVLKKRRQGRTVKDVLREGAISIIETYQITKDTLNVLYDYQDFIRVAVEHYMKDVRKRAEEKGGSERIIVFEDLQEMRKRLDL